MAELTSNQDLTGISPAAVLAADGSASVQLGLANMLRLSSTEAALLRAGLTPPTVIVPTPPLLPPPPVQQHMIVGLNTGPSENPGALKSMGIPFVRLEQTTHVLDFKNLGIGVVYLRSGAPNYLSTGLKSVLPAKVAEQAVADYKAQPSMDFYEFLNEPGGDWFWGENASSAENAKRYAACARAVAEAFAKLPKHPPLLISYDGGHDSSIDWGEKVFAADPGLHSLVDGITMHPYGGTGKREQAREGDRTLVELAFHKTGLPIYITEVGFNTLEQTGDSLKYSEAEQAANIASLIEWARKLGYIKAVMIFGDRDEKEGGGYGVRTHAGNAKLALKALQTAIAVS